MQILKSDYLDSGPDSATSPNFPIWGGQPSPLHWSVIDYRRPLGCVCVFILVICIMYGINGFSVLDEPAITKE